MRASLLLLVLSAGCAAGLDQRLERIKSVGPEGMGHAEASAAWQEVVNRGPAALLPLLHAFSGADPRAANWLRAAVDAVAERAMARNETLDPKGLEAFVVETGNDPLGRRVAYEWLVRIEPGAADRLLPGMLDDPGRELRRDAVARAIAAADKLLKAGDKPSAAEAFKKVFSHSRDREQVDEIAKQLKGLGVSVSVQAHYGVIDRWMLITTFDNTGMKGFDISYAPEKQVDLKSSSRGKGDLPIRIVEHKTADPHGKVDLNAALGKEMGAIAYAFAVVDSPADRPVEIRVGTNNAVKIFLNGGKVYFRNEYHHGMKMDQYVGKGRLRKGRNEVLLKVCQNEQKDDWAQSWSFQARLADRLGGGLPFTLVTEN